MKNFMSRKILCFAAIISFIAVMAITGCDSEVEGDIPDPSSVTQVVGIEGGKIEAKDGSWEFDIPAGALSTSTEITITPNTSSPGAVPIEYSQVSKTFRFEPHGLTFSKPAFLKYNYAQGNLPESGIEEKMISFYFINDDSTAEKAVTALNLIENRVIVEINHFSFGAALTFAIGLVNAGLITDPGMVEFLSDQVIAEFNALADDQARADFYIENINILGPFIDKTEEVLGESPIEDEFPTVDFPEPGPGDLGLPVAILYGEPSRFTPLDQAYIEIGGNDIVSYRYNLDETGFNIDEIDISEPIILWDLAPGEHTISVVGKNSESEWQDETNATTWSWTIDDTLPAAEDVILIGVPSGATDQTSFSISVSGDNLATYRYRLNSSTWSEQTGISTPIVLTGLTEDTYTLDVIVKNIAGLWQDELLPKSVEWTVANSAPVASDVSVTTEINTAVIIDLVAVDSWTTDLIYNTTQPLNGILEHVSGAQYTYTPEENFIGQDSFTFSAEDGELTSNTATVSININDGDGIDDSIDNCPNAVNPDQADDDGDGIGNACEPDSDGDGVIDDIDNCVDTPNPDQEDSDGDGIGEVCDTCDDLNDTDCDGFNNDVDICPDIPNPDQKDTDGDGIGDVCDDDIDGDGVDNSTDHCPCIANKGEYDGDYTIDNPADLAALSGYTSITGRIQIMATSLTNVNGLECLTSLGALDLYNNNSLSNLDGLINLTFIDVSLWVFDNDSLTNLDSLGNLTSTGSTIKIAYNDTLTNVNLNSLTSIGRSLILYANALTNINFDNLTSIEGELYIASNPEVTNLDLSNLNSVGDRVFITHTKLTNLDGLSNLNSVGVEAHMGGSLIIFNNSILTNLDGLSNLNSIGRSLNLTNNSALTNLDGLSNLTSIGERLSIYENDTLSNLDGLYNITTFDGIASSSSDDFEVYNNPNLPQCEVDDLLPVFIDAFTDSPDNFITDIHDNDGVAACD